jgi:hypothetical protein
MTDGPCVYRALVPIALPTHMPEPGTLLVEGQNIPFGWMPSAGDVDPLTPNSVLKYYAAGPKLPSALRSIQPKIYWRVRQHASPHEHRVDRFPTTHLSSHREWTLVGSDLPTINCM